MLKVLTKEFMSSPKKPKRVSDDLEEKMATLKDFLTDDSYFLDQLVDKMADEDSDEWNEAATDRIGGWIYEGGVPGSKAAIFMQEMGYDLNRMIDDAYIIVDEEQKVKFFVDFITTALEDKTIKNADKVLNRLESEHNDADLANEIRRRLAENLEESEEEVVSPTRLAERAAERAAERYPVPSAIQKLEILLNEGTMAELAEEVANQGGEEWLHSAKDNIKKWIEAGQVSGEKAAYVISALGYPIDKAIDEGFDIGDDDKRLNFYLDLINSELAQGIKGTASKVFDRLKEWQNSDELIEDIRKTLLPEALEGKRRVVPAAVKATAGKVPKKSTELREPSPEKVARVPKGKEKVPPKGKEKGKAPRRPSAALTPEELQKYVKADLMTTVKECQKNKSLGVCASSDYWTAMSGKLLNDSTPIKSGTFNEMWERLVERAYNQDIAIYGSEKFDKDYLKLIRQASAAKDKELRNYFMDVYEKASFARIWHYGDETINFADSSSSTVNENPIVDDEIAAKLEGIGETGNVKEVERAIKISIEEDGFRKKFIDSAITRGAARGPIGGESNNKVLDYLVEFRGDKHSYADELIGFAAGNHVDDVVDFIEDRDPRAQRASKNLTEPFRVAAANGATDVYQELKTRLGKKAPKLSPYEAAKNGYYDFVNRELLKTTEDLEEYVAGMAFRADAGGIKTALEMKIGGHKPNMTAKIIKNAVDSDDPAVVLQCITWVTVEQSQEKLAEIALIRAVTNKSLIVFEKVAERYPQIVPKLDVNKFNLGGFDEENDEHQELVNLIIQNVDTPKGSKIGGVPVAKFFGAALLSKNPHLVTFILKDFEAKIPESDITSKKDKITWEVAQALLENGFSKSDVIKQKFVEGAPLKNIKEYVDKNNLSQDEIISLRKTGMNLSSEKRDYFEEKAPSNRGKSGVSNRLKSTRTEIEEESDEERAREREGSSSSSGSESSDESSEERGGRKSKGKGKGKKDDMKFYLPLWKKYDPESIKQVERKKLKDGTAITGNMYKNWLAKQGIVKSEMSVEQLRNLVLERLRTGRGGRKAGDKGRPSDTRKLWNEETIRKSGR
jgi:hypothetical protein